jgi:hypothetical protein
MTYEGIEFVIHVGLGRNEWVVTIHFPDASEPLARSSMVKLCDGVADGAWQTSRSDHALCRRPFQLIGLRRRVLHQL